MYCHTLLLLIILAKRHDKNTLKVWEGYLYWFSSYSIFRIKGAFFRGKNSQHLVQTYQVLAKIDLKIQYFDVQNWITWEPIKISFSNFQGIFVISLGQNHEEEKVVAVQLTKPRPLFWSGYYSQRWCLNECNFNFFWEIVFTCSNKFQGLSEKGCNIFLPLILTYLEIFHITFLSTYRVFHNGLNKIKWL